MNVAEDESLKASESEELWIINHIVDEEINLLSKTDQLELLEKKDLIVYALYDYYRELLDEHGTINSEYLSIYLQKSLYLFSKCYLGQDFDDDFILLIGLFGHWSLDHLHSLSNEDFQLILHDAKNSLFLPVDEILKNKDDINMMHVPQLVKDVENSCQYFENSAKLFNRVDYYSKTVKTLTHQIHELKRNGNHIVSTDDISLSTMPSSPMSQHSHVLSSAVEINDEYVKTVSQTIQLLEKEYNLSFADADQKLDTMLKELARRQIQSYEEIELWNENLLLKTAEFTNSIDHSNTNHHYSDPSSSSSSSASAGIINLNHLRDFDEAKLTALIHAKEEYLSSYMSCKVGELNSRYAENQQQEREGGEEVAHWLKIQALEKYRINEDISNVLTSVYSDMINCYIQKRNKITSTSSSSASKRY